MAKKETAAWRNHTTCCENCGERYSTTYKRCPFCDERAGTQRVFLGATRGRRAQSLHPAGLVGTILSLAVIFAAMFIVFRLLSPLLRLPTGQGGAGSSGDQSSAASTTGGTSQTPGSVSMPQDEPPTQNNHPPLQSITLSRAEFTLKHNEIYQLIATLTPNDTGLSVTWTSSDASLATVDDYGNIVNLNSTGSLASVTITASAGEQSAQCLVYCRPAGGTSADPEPEPTDPPESNNPGTSTGLSAGAAGTVTGAASGLNVRSGPGSNHGVLASLVNGDKVTILEDTGTGWYQVTYSPGKTGYVSKNFIK